MLKKFTYYPWPELLLSAYLLLNFVGCCLLSGVLLFKPLDCPDRPEPPAMVTDVSGSCG